MAPSNVSGSGSNNNSNNNNGNGANSIRMWLAILVAASSLAFGAGLQVASASAERLTKIENSIDRLSASVTAGFTDSIKDRNDIRVRLGVLESKVEGKR